MVGPSARVMSARETRESIQSSQRCIQPDILGTVLGSRILNIAAYSQFANPADYPRALCTVLIFSRPSKRFARLRSRSARGHTRLFLSDKYRFSQHITTRISSFLQVTVARTRTLSAST